MLSEDAYSIRNNRRNLKSYYETFWLCHYRTRSRFLRRRDSHITRCIRRILHIKPFSRIHTSRTRSLAFEASERCSARSGWQHCAGAEFAPVEQQFVRADILIIARPNSMLSRFAGSISKKACVQDSLWWMKDRGLADLLSCP